MIASRARAVTSSFDQQDAIRVRDRRIVFRRREPRLRCRIKHNGLLDNVTLILIDISPDWCLPIGTILHQVKSVTELLLSVTTTHRLVDNIDMESMKVVERFLPLDSSTVVRHQNVNVGNQAV